MKDAIQFTGYNYTECRKYVGGNCDNTLNYPNITTSDGTMRVNPGDWIVKEPVNNTLSIQHPEDVSMDIERIMIGVDPAKPGSDIQVKDGCIQHPIDPHSR